MLVQELCNDIRSDVEGVGTSGFPIEVFPEKVQEILLDLSAYENFNIEYAAAAMLSAASAAIGNSHEILIKGEWATSPALYMMLVGRPGLGKTPPMNFAYRPIREQDEVNREKYSEELDAYEREHSSKKEEGGGGQSGKPHLVKTVISDFTPEALMTIHNDNLRGVAVYTDEILSLFKQASRYGKDSILLEILLSAWSGQPLDTIRKTDPRPIHINTPCINVIGSIQTKLMSEIIKKEYTASGLTDRFLFVFPRNRKISRWQKQNDNVPRKDMTGRWRTIIGKLLSLECTPNEKDNGIIPKRLMMADDALDYFYGWYNNIIDSVNATEDDSLVESRQMKTCSNAARLALIIHLLRWASDEVHKDFIDLCSVKAAIRMTEYFEDSYLRIVKEMDEAEVGDAKELWFAALPAKFTTEAAKLEARKWSIPDRTMFDLLRKMARQKPPQIRKVAHGVYEKMQEADALAVCSIAVSHYDNNSGNDTPNCKSAEMQTANEDDSCTLSSKDDDNG